MANSRLIGTNANFLNFLPIFLYFSSSHNHLDCLLAMLHIDLAALVNAILSPILPGMYLALFSHRCDLPVG